MTEDRSAPMKFEHRTEDRIRTVTEATFQNLILDGSGPITVEFMSFGCGFCRAIEPILQQVAENMHSKQKFFRVNVPIESELATFYGIEGTPTFVMFLNGTEVGRTEGVEPTMSSVTAIVTQPFET